MPSRHKAKEMKRRVSQRKATHKDRLLALTLRSETRKVRRRSGPKERKQASQQRKQASRRRDSLHGQGGVKPCTQFWVGGFVFLSSRV